MPPAQPGAVCAAVALGKYTSGRATAKRKAAARSVQPGYKQPRSKPAAGIQESPSRRERGNEDDERVECKVVATLVALSVPQTLPEEDSKAEGEDESELQGKSSAKRHDQRVEVKMQTKRTQSRARKLKGAGSSEPSAEDGCISIPSYTTDTIRSEMTSRVAPGTKSTSITVFVPDPHVLSSASHSSDSAGGDGGRSSAAAAAAAAAASCLVERAIPSVILNEDEDGMVHVPSSPSHLYRRLRSATIHGPSVLHTPPSDSTSALVPPLSLSPSSVAGHPSMTDGRRKRPSTVPSSPDAPPDLPRKSATKRRKLADTNVGQSAGEVVMAGGAPAVFAVHKFRVDRRARVLQLDGHRPPTKRLLLQQIQAEVSTGDHALVLHSTVDRPLKLQFEDSKSICNFKRLLHNHYRGECIEDEEEEVKGLLHVWEDVQKVQIRWKENYTTIQPLKDVEHLGSKWLSLQRARLARRGTSGDFGNITDEIMMFNSQ
jgi:hypothetical protein